MPEAVGKEVDWRDPELWPPKGLGCSWCHVGAPVLTGLSWGGGLCAHCLERCLGWPWERVADWLISQRLIEARVLERAAAIAAWKRGGDASLADAYEEKYGVMLIQ